VKRLGIFLIFVALATALSLMLVGCAQPDAPERKPAGPQNVLRRYKVPMKYSDGAATVAEFRDSAGRTCVLVFGSNGRAALDCGHPLPPLRYEDLPE
jgi:hypothetical protein